MSKNEKEERRKNIIIKGIEKPRGIEIDGRERERWIKEFIKERIGVECNIVFTRINGKVIVVRVGCEEERNEIMRNKYKLKGGSIFIENDLSWEERKIQERINK